MKHRLLWLAAGPALLAALPSPARADDGVIEINMARAIAGGVTSADTPGFPVTINRPGSYRLTSSLATGVTGTTAIEVRAGFLESVSAVQIDLNGFEIHCSDPGQLCAITTFTGVGIDATGIADVTVRNGRIAGMGSSGVIAGPRARIEDVSAALNSSDGINVGSDSAVVHCTSNNNGGYGIAGGDRALVRDSTAVANNLLGIQTGQGSVAIGNHVASHVNTSGMAISDGSVVVRNAVIGSGSTGLAAFSGSVVRENLVRANNTGIEVMEGTVVAGNVVADNVAPPNGGVGIYAYLGSVLLRNSMRGNSTEAFDLPVSVGYSQNVATGNSFGEAQGSGGTQLAAGSNFCGTDTTCP